MPSDIFRIHLGDTPLSDDERKGLIPSISTQGELNEFEFHNILSGRRWALNPRRLGKSDVLSATFLLELHRRMFRATWRWAGKFRTTNKNFGVDPHRIATDVGALLGDTEYWIAHATHPADEIALRFHHRLVLIYPFPNGNGRHSRLMADVLVTKLGRPEFPWGANTGDPESIRQSYLKALRLADQADNTALVTFARSGKF